MINESTGIEERNRNCFKFFDQLNKSKLEKDRVSMFYSDNLANLLKENSC